MVRPQRLRFCPILWAVSALAFMAGCTDGTTGDDDASVSESSPTPTPIPLPQFDPRLTVDAESLEFGEVATGASTSLSLTLTNEGEGVLEITSILPENGDNAAVYVVDPGGPYDSLASLGSMGVTVTFQPQDEAEYNDNLVITSNDPENPVYKVALTGVGVLPLPGDADNDGYSLPDDCNDEDSSIYPNASEVPYDGIDQNCDGIDLDDVDQDGYNASESGGTDCDDSDEEINPGALETAYDGIDQDCTGADLTDVDGDGHGATVAGGDDCDDTDKNTYPGAAEFSDGKDNDCNGLADDGLNTTDDDGDSYSEATGDCNDNDAATYPGAIELPYDGIDQDCTGLDLTDVDGDGYDASAAGGNDCDDDDADVHPSVTETCNGRDDDCNSQIDDGVQNTYYQDSDNDSFGNANVSVAACSAPAGFVSDASDCNDVSSAAFPGNPEICDGLDNDCNSQTDEGVQLEFYADDDGDSFGSEVDSTLACAPPSGFVADSQDCDDTNELSYPGAVELCDSEDNNCDGQTDEGVKVTYYQDSDGDQYGNAASSTQACAAGNGYVADKTDCNDGSATVYPNAKEVAYDGVDQNCDGKDLDDVDADGYVAKQAGGNDCDDNDANTHPGAGETVDSKDNNCNGQIDEGTSVFDNDGDGYSSVQGDCDDTNPKVYPNAAEVCDSLDNNCNGQIDENVKSTFYKDSDVDGYGAASLSTQACNAPTGYVKDNTDCNDSDAQVHPNATEACNSKDDNCNGVVDEGVKGIYYRDTDGDGYGVSSIVVEACSAASGYSPVAGDCDDTKSSINPGATEACNGADDNCNGQIDEGVATVYYRDGDTDGYGSSISTQACAAPPGYVTKSGDCDDTRANVNPAATEVCDTLDNNCNGSVDEGVTKTYYQDNDKDGYGTVLNTLAACSLPGGYSATAGDCNDSASTIYPGAAEKCNSIDDNCNGQIDEGVTTTYYKDADGDTYGNPNVSTKTCSPSTGYVANKTDCDDTNASVNPGAKEVCNGIDDNCNGDIDGADSIDGQTWYYDGDSDGYGTGTVSVTSCAQPSGFVSNNIDCDDAYTWGEEEVCDGRDNDCNGDSDFKNGNPALRVGYYARYVAVGDWNKDGHPDIATANYNGASISVAFFTGGGSFAVRQTVSVNSGPMRIVPVDYDGDSDVDLVVANYAGQTLSFVRNDGKGNFVVGSTLSLGFQPWGIVSGDFDLDGDQDLAVNSYSGGGVTILKNNAGSFSLVNSSFVVTAANPIGLVAGDWDKDGDLDLAATNSGSDNVSLLKNNSGSFTVFATASVGGAPYDITTGDWNKDGLADLATANYNGNSVTILKGLTGGFFSPSATVNVGSDCSAIVAQDLDKDGDTDLAVTNYSSATVSILKNSGSGTFAVAETVGSPYQPFELAAADLDQDGDIDLAVAAYANGSPNGIVHVMRNRNGFFNSPGAISVPAQPYGTVVSDFNGDGLEDFAVAIYGNHTVMVYTQTAGGTFTAASTTNLQYYPWELAAGDFDKDGDIDLAVSTGHDNARVYLLMNNGLGTSFTPSYIQAQGRTYGIVAGDWDKDGDLDLAWSVYYLGSSNSNLVGLAFNNGKGVYTLGATIQVGTYPQGMVSGDFDKDGDLDIAVTNHLSNNISVLKNNGSGGFTEQGQINSGTNPINVVTADYNGDGYLDLAVANQGTGSVGLMFNDSVGYFQSMISVSGGAQPTGIANVDLDSDGDLDLVTSNLGQGTVTQVVNGGTGIFAEAAYTAVPGTGYFVSPIKLGSAGNTNLGLIVSNYHSKTVTLLTRDCQ